MNKISENVDKNAHIMNIESESVRKKFKISINEAPKKINITSSQKIKKQPSIQSFKSDLKDDIEPSKIN